MEKSRSAISTPRDGRNGGGATKGQHCPGLPDFRGQRDLLPLRPEVARREQAIVRHWFEPNGGEIADLLVGLTEARKTWGFGLCFLHLRNVQGRLWNHKRVYRIYCELELNLRIKPRKRLKRDKPDALAVPEAPNLTWSMRCPVGVCLQTP